MKALQETGADVTQNRTDNEMEEEAGAAPSSKSLPENMIEEQNEGGRYEVNGESTQQKPKAKKKKICISIGCVLLAILLFLAGVTTCWYSMDPEIRALWRVKQTIDAEYYEKIPDEKFYGKIFSVINNDLLDAYSTYLNEDDYAATNADMAGNRSGIGLLLSTKDAQGNPQMLVTRVPYQSPAEQAGILAGDFIIGFGKTQDAMIDSVVFDDFSNFIDDTPTGGAFFVKIRRGNDNHLLQIVKSDYVESYVSYRTNSTSYGFDGEDGTIIKQTASPLTCLPEKTAYIRLTRFGGNVTDAFATAMQRFKTDGMQNLVLDLRGNGGGYLDAMLEIASYFCKTATDDEPIAAIADYGKKKEYFYAEDNLYYEFFNADSKICVLADCDSASASECLIGCMLDYGAIAYKDVFLVERGGVAKTFGKGIMQVTYTLNADGEDAVRLTTAVIRWPKGNCIHGRGILPSDGAITVSGTDFGDAEIAQSIQKWNIQS